ncbi:RICIN domain-containing protein [Kribbella sp. NBC_01505]|uniref:RICIN domain-containing protein n=1 Tax=Kribbella sp. NBC_01505 TaxID=2903580 RepID=UPI00386AE8B5
MKFRRVATVLTMLATAAAAALVPVPAQAAIEPGYAFVVRSTGSVLTVGPGFTAAVDMIQRADLSLAGQRYVFIHRGNGYISIQDRNWWNGCVAVAFQSATAGAGLKSTACSPDDLSQLWDLEDYPEDPTYFRLVNVNSNLVASLEYLSINDGVRFVLRPRTSGSWSQLFTLRLKVQSSARSFS